MRLKVALAKSGNNWQIYGSSAEPSEEMTDFLKEDTKWMFSSSPLEKNPEISIVEVDLLEDTKQFYIKSTDRIAFDLLQERLNPKFYCKGGIVNKYFSLYNPKTWFYNFVASYNLSDKKVYTNDEDFAVILAELLMDDFKVILTVEKKVCINDEDFATILA